jgi:hypothetical protein
VYYFLLAFYLCSCSVNIPTNVIMHATWRKRDMCTHYKITDVNWSYSDPQWYVIAQCQLLVCEYSVSILWNIEFNHHIYITNQAWFIHTYWHYAQYMYTLCTLKPYFDYIFVYVICIIIIFNTINALSRDRNMLMTESSWRHRCAVSLSKKDTLPRSVFIIGSGLSGKNYIALHFIKWPTRYNICISMQWLLQWKMYSN